MSQVFNRRRFVANGLALASAFQLQRAASALGFAPQTEVCKLSPEQTIGPYFVDGELLRSSIGEGKPGVPLSLRLAIMNARTCSPLANAVVDLWHCDALGIYSGYTARNATEPMPGRPGGGRPGPPPDWQAGGPPEPPPDWEGGGPPGPPPGGPGPGGPRNKPSDKLTFLRGIQLTGEDGTVRFQTIFPGFYMGRTNHIHFQVRVGGHAEGHTYASGHTVHVGQIFFPEDVTEKLMQREPYASHSIHRTMQAEDDIFENQYGALSVATVRLLDENKAAPGMQAELIAAVDAERRPTRAPQG